VKGQSEEAELVVDKGSGLHGDGARGEDAEVKEGGSDPFQIAGVGEEREDHFSGSGEEEGAFKMVEHLTSCFLFVLN
jgi:hypothetical protein